MESRNANQELINQFSTFFNRLSIKEDLQYIPLFYGNTQENSVKEWLEECLMYAAIFHWKEEDYKCIFGSRLRADAQEFHANRMKRFAQEPYSDWRQHLLKHFGTSMDVEKSKYKFYNLKQKPNQQMQHFIDDLVKSYELIYGNTQESSDQKGSSLREDLLLEVFFNGIRSEIKDIMLHGNFLLNYTWPMAIKAAIQAENSLIFRTLTAPTTINCISTELKDKLTAEFKKMEEMENTLIFLSAQQEESNEFYQHPFNAANPIEEFPSFDEYDAEEDKPYNQYAELNAFQNGCFNCGEKGHRQVQCFSLSSEAQEEIDE